MNPYALSIRQPWAEAVLRLGKDIENRDWRFIPGWLDTFIVHSGLQREPGHADRMIEDITGTRVPADLPLGAFLGTVQVVTGHLVRPGCCTSPWAMPDAMVHLQLANPKPFPEPVPGKGRLGLWRPDVDLPVSADA
jgi:hypothetical protein